MRVCLIAVEIFAWGKYGGFGRATRIIGRELAKRGIDVIAVVPRRADQQPVEDLDGIQVLSYPPKEWLSSLDLYKKANADIYHSMEPSLGTYLAQRAMPHRKHLVTFRDPRDLQDWIIEFKLPSLNALQVFSNWLYEDNWLVKHAVRRADACFTTAHCLIPKTKKKYRLKNAPEFLPTPVAIPDHIEKSTEPTVCYLARLDRRKRPELFLDLASYFPEVKFLVAGQSRNAAWEAYLRKKYAHLSNLQFLGFVDQFSGEGLASILGKSWVMVNTSAREGLPNSFLEAAAHGCAILSSVNPDEFASRFGYHAKDNDFVHGLRTLLANDLWQQRGDMGRKEMQEVFSLGNAIDQHLALYQKVVGSTP
ncbi:MAG: glycosyltransferase family 4 protein [Anaerolineales bacterium]|nr:glycosyltransferase family 4 protein [Anaerolineales bacterium]